VALAEFVSKRKMPHGAAFLKCDVAGLDTDAELGGLLIAGVRIKVVGSAVVELVTQSKFTAKVEADGGDSHTDREPANDPERFALFLFVEECQRCSGGGHSWLSLLD
jgi:hypothetical protein